MTTMPGKAPRRVLALAAGVGTVGLALATAFAAPAELRLDEAVRFAGCLRGAMRTFEQAHRAAPRTNHSDFGTS